MATRPRTNRWGFAINAQLRQVMLSKADLKRRGWTERLLREFASEPDNRQTNPNDNGGAPLCLYAPERVASIEASAEFQAAQQRQRQRGQSQTVAKRRLEIDAQ